MSLHDKASIHRETPKRLNEALNASPNDDTGDPVIRRGKVTQVLAIEYKNCELSTARLHGVIEYEGRERDRWVDYDEIRKNHGIAEPLKKFGPTWSS